MPAPRFNPTARFCARLIAVFLTVAVGGRATGADSRVHLTYWEKWTGAEGRAMRATVDAFNAAQDKIAVDFLVMRQIEQKTVVATAGGDPPDLAGMFAYNIASLADAEALTPLDAFMARDGISPDAWAARYTPIYADLARHSGRTYGVVTTPTTVALHWNKTLFREAGLDPERPPRTLAELNEFSRKLTKRDPATGALLQVGFLPDEQGWWPWAFPLWFGGRLFDGEKVTLASDPRTLEALRWVEGITRGLGLKELRAFEAGFGQFGSSQNAFFAGKVAMVFQGVWLHSYIANYKPGLDYGVAPWPAAQPGIADFTPVEADMVVIPRGAKHAEEAWEFVKYLAGNNPRARSREELSGVEILCYLQAKDSPLRAWSPFFEQHHPHPHVQVFRDLGVSTHAARVPDLGIWQEYDREVQAMFERVRLLEATPEEALRFADARLTQSWQEHQRSLTRWRGTRPMAETQ